MTRVACIGAGTVGHSWAVVFARAGYEVALYDAQPGAVATHALPGIRRTIEMLAESSNQAEPVATILARINNAESIADAVADTFYVQESVREDVAVKRQVFLDIAAAAPPTAILASSTSAIPGSEFLGEVNNPQRALVVHPVNPPSLIPLVELCGTGRTSQATIEQVRSLMRGIGMSPIVLKKEIDGFILNRLQFTLVAEALHLVGEGYCDIEDIDAVLSDGLALRWAFLGPFQVAHLNAPDGIQGFVDRLGPMMRRLGKDAQPDYDWTSDQISDAHSRLSETIPVADIPRRQNERDRCIVALRRLKAKLS
jgi:L-gulonate 3-dehydrogenase